MWLVVTFIWEIPPGERLNLGVLIRCELRLSRFLEFLVVPSSPMHTSRLRKSCRRTTSRHAAIDLQHNTIRMTRALRGFGKDSRHSGRWDGCDATLVSV